MPPAPATAHQASLMALADLPEYRQQIFGLQLDRWWTALEDGLLGVYPSAVAEELALRLVALAARSYAARDPELLRLDIERTLSPDWFQTAQAIGYAAYADRFAEADSEAGALAGVRAKIPYLKEVGVTYLHLMPLLRPREGDSDGGYAVVDYRSVRPDMGTIQDLRELAAALRAQGISLVLDLVLNHVACEHAWAVAARAGDPQYREYFYCFPDRAMPDAYERTLPEVFPAFAPGNFTWDAELTAWVWTTFNSFQWDVNWSNPQVFYEYADIVLFLANLGVEVVRLDAIAFVWKRLGTNSQNQPEVHAITQALRSVARIAAPAMIFKAEAIVAPTDLVHYLGRGEHHAKVSDLAYHNSLMVQIWSMLAAGDARLAAQALRSLPPIPSTTAWITYVRGHDDIGWAIDPADAASVGLNGWEHQQFLSDFYIGEFPGSTGRGLVFQANAATGDRRISGTTASLIGLEAAVEAADSGQLDLAVRRILLAHAIIFGWGGLPVIWAGDELGQPNDPKWAEEPGHADDNRWTHRPRLDWTLAAAVTDAAAPQDTPSGRVFTGLRHLIATRTGLEYLHASVPAEVVELDDPGVLGVLRRHPIGNLLGLYNVTADWRPWAGWRLDELELRDGVDAFTGEPPNWGGDFNIWLAPYQAIWLVPRRTVRG